MLIRGMEDVTVLHQCGRGVNGSIRAFQAKGRGSSPRVRSVNIKEQNQHLVEQNKLLKAHITSMQKAAEEKNKKLSAMHWVWCSGACGSEIDEEVLLYAERNTKRLRQKYEGQLFRRGYKGMREGTYSLVEMNRVIKVVRGWHLL